VFRQIFGKSQVNLLNDSLAESVQTDTVDAEEAMSKAIDKAGLAKQIKRNTDRNLIPDACVSAR
jgi:hypothetical protein